MLGIRLSRLPVSAKVFCTLFLLGVGCGAIAAAVQAALQAGASSRPPRRRPRVPPADCERLF